MNYAKQARSNYAAARIAQKHIAAQEQRNMRSIQDSKEGLLTHQEIEEYTQHLFAQLERIVSACVDKNVVREFMANIQLGVHQLPSLKKWTAQDKFYDKDIVDNYVVQYIAAYIEQESYAYIFKRTRDDKFAQKVATQMQCDIAGILLIPDSLELDVIDRFLGKNLIEILEQYIASK